MQGIDGSHGSSSDTESTGVGTSTRRSSLTEVYRRLEPDGADTWNPLHRDRELDYRVNLYRKLCTSLRHASRLEAMRVLDVGCGNGRSTRLYIEFGLRPVQLTGVDVRRGAIALARELHPGIRFMTTPECGLPFSDASFEWVSLAAVLSSVPSSESRRNLVSEATRVLVPGGHLFYFDRKDAHPLTPAPLALPESMFSALRQVAAESVRLGDAGPDAGPTHRFALFEKPAPPDCDHSRAR